MGAALCIKFKLIDLGSGLGFGFSTFIRFPSDTTQEVTGVKAII